MAKANKKAAAMGKTKKDKGLHVVAAPVVKLTRQERLAADVALLDNYDMTNTDFVITDFDELLARATEAMGSFASEAKPAGEILESWTKRKIGSVNSHIFTVHPLSIGVMPGMNRRTWNHPDMIARVAELTPSVSRGVQKPLEVFVSDDKFFLVGGETRLRCVLHAWVRKGIDPKHPAPVGIPITLEAAGTNDARRHLNVALSNDQKTMNPIEIAQKYFDAHSLGMSPEEIATHVGKSVIHVESHIGMLAMPEAVLAIVRRGMIVLSLAYKWWNEENRDTAKTMARLTAAEKERAKTGASHIMPKHSPSETENVTSSEDGGDVVAAEPGRKNKNKGADISALVERHDRTRPHWMSKSIRVVDGIVLVRMQKADFAAVANFFGDDEIPEEAKELEAA